MCGIDPPKIEKPKRDENRSLALRQIELARAGTGSSKTTNPTGALGVPNASVAGKMLSA